MDSRRTPQVAPPSPSRNPRRHGQQLAQQLTGVQSARSISAGVDPDLVFKLRAEGGRLNEDMLANRGVTPLAETVDYTYFVLSQDEGRALAEALRAYSARGADQEGAKGPASSLFDRLAAIEPYGPEDRRGPGIDDIDMAQPRAIVDVTVWPSNDLPEAQRRAETVVRVIGVHQGEVLHRDVRVRRNVLRVALSPAGVDDLLNTSVVERVRTPPVPFIDPSDWQQVTAADLIVDDQAGGIVGVLDDAPATGHPLLNGLVASVTEIGPEGYAWPAQGHHGSQVVGRVLFPRLHEELRAHEPITAVGQVHVARILEPSPHNPRETQFPGGELGEPHHLVVERAIRLLHERHGVRVFNLSVGYREPFDATHVGELTETLDDLARELDVVIVVPTGNAGVDLQGRMASGHHAHDDYPSYLAESMHRLSEPGPAALALTVGAIAHSDAPMERTPPRIGDKAIAGIGELSPFSRTGPGIGPNTARCNKPDLVHEGGNWVLNDTNQVVLEDAGVAVISTALDQSGRLFRACCGTSFAAPAVARCAADVLHAYPAASANLVRALVVSSANEPPGAQRIIDVPARRRLYGAGMPDSVRATSSGTRRVTMTYDGDMAVDTVAIHPLPVPSAFAAGKSATRRISVTLAFDPPVRRQRREYLAGTMQIDLYRAVDVDDLAEMVSKQDAEDAHPLIKDRRRPKLEPGVDSVRSGTLQTRFWMPKLLKVDDGDTYFLVVTHRRQTWARNGDYERQRYALAVTLEEHSLVGLDLYASVTQQVRAAVRARIRS
jgi:hypothetical protein